MQIIRKRWEKCHINFHFAIPRCWNNHQPLSGLVFVQINFCGFGPFPRNIICADVFNVGSPEIKCVPNFSHLSFMLLQDQLQDKPLGSLFSRCYLPLYYSLLHVRWSLYRKHLFYFRMINNLQSTKLLLLKQHLLQK